MLLVITWTDTATCRLSVWSSVWRVSPDMGFKKKQTKKQNQNQWIKKKTNPEKRKYSELLIFQAVLWSFAADPKMESKEDQWMGVTVQSQGPGGNVVVSAKGLTYKNIWGLQYMFWKVCVSVQLAERELCLSLLLWFLVVKDFSVSLAK